MNRIFLLILTAFLVNYAKGQKRLLTPPPPTEEELKQEVENHTCLRRSRYTLQQRLQFYPFSKAAAIKVVSFDNKPDTNGNFVLSGNRLPIKSDNVDYSALDEVKPLDKGQVDTLTDILYNTGYRGSIFTKTETGCYNPRNAILFIDKAGKTVAFLELCFECGGHRLSSKKVKAGEFCNEKYDLLKNFFAIAGIEIGITKGVGLIKE